MSDRMSDPVLEELHAARRALAEENDNDLEKIVAALQRRGKEAGRKYVDPEELSMNDSDAA